MWLVLHGRVLANKTKRNMGIGQGMRSLCGEIEETIHHALKDYPLVLNIWLQVIPLSKRNVFFMGEIDNWINDNISSLKQWKGRGS